MTCSDTYLWYWQIVLEDVMLALVPHHRAPADLTGLVSGDAHVTLWAPAPARGVTAATRK